MFRTVVQLFLFPLWLLLGRNPPMNSREKTAAFLDRCRGPIAHRGGIPENTLAAIRQSKQDGAVGVEVDLAFTKDNHPVLLHDTTVDRTSNGNGDIDSLTFEEVRKLDFGIKAGKEFAGTKIPTLQETMSLTEELNLLLFLEVKSNHKEALVTILNMFADEQSLYDKVAVISFCPSFLLELRKQNPEIITGLTVRGTELAYFGNGTRRYSQWWLHYPLTVLDKVVFLFLTKYAWSRLGVGMILPHKGDILSGRFDIEQYRSQGIGVVSWTVNKEEEKEHFRTVLRVPFMTDHVDGTVPEQPV